MSEALRVAVVGVGHLGKHHARILAAMPGVTLVGVADPDEARAAGATTLSVDAGKTLLIDGPAAVIAAADEAGIAIVGRQRQSASPGAEVPS